MDDDYATEILVESLEFRGYSARRINSVTAALQSIDDLVAADLVILDIIMERPPTDGPKISGDKTTGMTLLRVLREKRPDLPILVFSATTDREVIDALNVTPHTVFLSKWSTPSIRDFIERVDHTIGASANIGRPQAFIVHGHDTVEKLALKNYLQNTLGFPEPIVLHEQPNIGRSIIEKLEDYATRIDLVFVLLTPDDKVATIGGTNEERRQARQNVIFELGYFLGILGRLSGRVLLLYKGALDLPSDISGIIYIDISKGVDAAGENIRREVTHVK